jgi:hypothetical protein
MPNAEAEYEKLKGLLEILSMVCEGKDKLLEEAEISLKGNIGKLDALTACGASLDSGTEKIV